jgi:hypothetical protein
MAPASPTVDCHARLRELGGALAGRARVSAPGSRLDREERDARDLMRLLDLIRDARATLAVA